MKFGVQKESQLNKGAARITAGLFFSSVFSGMTITKLLENTGKKQEYQL